MLSPKEYGHSCASPGQSNQASNALALLNTVGVSAGWSMDMREICDKASDVDPGAA